MLLKSLTLVDSFSKLKYEQYGKNIPRKAFQWLSYITDYSKCLTFKIKIKIIDNLTGVIPQEYLFLYIYMYSCAKVDSSRFNRFEVIEQQQ